MQTLQISDSLQIVAFPVHQAEATSQPAPRSNIHYVFAVDVSGSMSSELPRVRQDFINKIAGLMQPGDTISIVWFSGRGQCDVLLRAFKVSGAPDLSQVTTAVNNWLRPVGMTGFLDPLRRVKELATYLKTLGGATSLQFITDGCDNCWSRGEILQAAKEVGALFGATTYVQYGPWADGPYLAAMAQASGGSVVFARDYDAWEPVFRGAFGKAVSRSTVKLSIDNTVGGFAFGVMGDEILTFDAASGIVDVPAEIDYVYAIQPSKDAHFKSPVHAPVFTFQKGLYAAACVYGQRMQSKVVLPVLRELGDVALVECYSKAFGKIKTGEFTEAARRCASNREVGVRYAKGYSATALPDPNAFTIVDFLQIFTEDKNNRVRMDEVKYSAIGRKMVDANEVFTPEEQAKMDALTADLGKAKSVKKAKEVQAEIDALLASKPKPIKFIADPATGGYANPTLVLNDDSPNISLSIMRKGHVDLSERLLKKSLEAEYAALEKAGTSEPIPDLSAVPARFECVQFKTYTLVKHGETNVDVLPVVLTEDSWSKLAKRGVVQGKYTDGWTEIRLCDLPLINERMVQGVSAKDMFELEYAREKLKAERKVLDAFHKLYYPALDAKQVANYGEGAAKWLKRIGLSNGEFNPRPVPAPKTDFYIGKELHCVVESLSALPSLTAVQKKLSAILETNVPGGKKKPVKLTKGESLMAPMVQLVETKQAKLSGDALKTWLEEQSKKRDKEIKEKSFLLAQIRFAVCVANVWFEEAKSLDDTKFEVTLDGEKVTCTAELKEPQIWT